MFCSNLECDDGLIGSNSWKFFRFHRVITWDTATNFRILNGTPCTLFDLWTLHVKCVRFCRSKVNRYRHIINLFENKFGLTYFQTILGKMKSVLSHMLLYNQTSSTNNVVLNLSIRNSLLFLKLRRLRADLLEWEFFRYWSVRLCSIL